MTKKLFYLLAILCLFSCNKEYTCTCTSDIDGSEINKSHYNLSESDAESACQNADAAPDITCILENY